MPRFEVWGEWQEYDQARTVETSTVDAAAREALNDADAFPDWNDGDKARVYIREEGIALADDEDAVGDAGTMVYVGKLHIRSEVTVSRER